MEKTHLVVIGKRWNHAQSY